MWLAQPQITYSRAMYNNIRSICTFPRRNEMHLDPWSEREVHHAQSGPLRARLYNEGDGPLGYTKGRSADEQN